MRRERNSRIEMQFFVHGKIYGLTECRQSVPSCCLCIFDNVIKHDKKRQEIDSHGVIFTFQIICQTTFLRYKAMMISRHRYYPQYRRLSDKRIFPGWRSNTLGHPCPDIAFVNTKSLSPLSRNTCQIFFLRRREKKKNLALACEGAISFLPRHHQGKETERNLERLM